MRNSLAKIFCDTRLDRKHSQSLTSLSSGSIVLLLGIPYGRQLLLLLQSIMNLKSISDLN